MTAKNIKLVALALVVMLALSGCNLIRTDPAYIAQQEAEEAARVQAAYEADMAQVVATFEGGNLTKGEIVDDYNEQLNMYAAYLNYNNYMMMMYTGQASNTSLTREDAVNLRNQVAAAHVQRKVLENKIAELNLGAFTEDELNEISESARTEYQTYLNMYISSGMDEANAKSYLALDGISENTIYQSVYGDWLEKRLKPATTNDVTVNEEDITAKYTSLVETDKAAAVTDIEDKVQQSQTVYYIPENSKYIKHVFLMPDEAVRNARSEAESALNQAKNDVADLEKKAADGEDVAADLEARKAALAEAEQAVKNAEAAIWENVSERLNKVTKAIADGTDFDAIIAEMSDDNQHGLESVVKNGYLVCAGSTQWDEVFAAKAAAMQTVGEISEPILGTVGVHVMMYAAEATSGEVALDAVKDEVSALALADKKEEAYHEAEEKWITDANVQYDFSGWNL